MDYILGPLDYIFLHLIIIDIITLPEGHSNYCGDVIFGDILFGTFYLPKSEEPSNEIGIAEMPNYPQIFFGAHDDSIYVQSLKKEAEQINEMTMD